MNQAEIEHDIDSLTSKVEVNKRKIWEIQRENDSLENTIALLRLKRGGLLVEA